MVVNAEDKLLIKSIWKSLRWLIVLFVASKLTGGIALWVLVAFGAWAAFSQKLGLALSCYVLYPLLVVSNPYLIGRGAMGMVALRLGFMVMTVLLMISAGQRRGQESVPLGLLWLYLAAAALSSLGGYHPVISYLKIVNFAFFLVGIWLGMRNIDKRPKDLLFLRGFLLALAVVIIGGSLLTIPFPGVAYFASNQAMIRAIGVEGANEMMRSGAASGRQLLCGITNQSQCLAPLSVVTICWVLCDMIFVERRISKLHIALLIAGMPLLYLTRSRCALLSIAVGMFLIYTYCFQIVAVSRQIKVQLRSIMFGLLAVAGILAVGAEIKDQSITKWIRKTNDVEGDQRSLSESFTASRGGLVAENMFDFHQNPFLGKGFQVAYDFQYIYKPGEIVLSAPIEKGVLPTMILGEGGILGAVCFAIFLAGFYGVCAMRRYAVTATLFSVLLVTNLAEATLFSTGGAGGIIWVMSIVGGFCIDMVTLTQKREEQFTPFRPLPSPSWR